MEALKLISRNQTLRKSVRQTGAAILLTLGCSNAFAQLGGPIPGSTEPPSTAKSPSTPANKPWIVRDPGTGRVFQQHLVPVTVPVTRWEARTVDQTVYEPRVATQLQQVSQTTYVPNTQYVMQPKVTGWWNPFKQPTQAYQYVPVTNWVPQTQQIPHPITTQQWVPKQQKFTVYQPVQSTEVRQQLVQTELPQPQSAPAVIASGTSPRQPLFRLPILAQQRVLPWAAPSSGTYPSSYAASAPMTSYATPGSTSPYSPALSSWNGVSQQPTSAYSPPVTPPQYATTGLRPVSFPRSQLVLPPLPLPRFASSPYSAPLRTTTSVGSTASRDTLQSGMQPTVLR